MRVGFLAFCCKEAATGREDPSHAPGQTRPACPDGGRPGCRNDRHLTRVEPSSSSEHTAAAGRGQPYTWDGVRAQFALSDEYIHLSAMLIASHPKPVRDAIEAHRRGMDASPLTYLFQNNRPLQEAARAAAGQCLGVDASDIALTDSTTMGVSLVYNGLRLTPDQEILTTEQDYYVTHEATRLASKRTGAKVRKVSLYEQIQGITAEQIVERSHKASRLPPASWPSPGCTRAPG